MLNLKHGGHVLDSDVEGAEATASKMDDVVVADLADHPTETPFGYLFPELTNDPDAHLSGDPETVVALLNVLGSAMVDDAPAQATDPQIRVNSNIPAIYTYWGQFIDHDMTANTDRNSKTSDITKPDLSPIAPSEVTASLKNLRRPNLDLDSLYGDGPAAVNPNDNDNGFYDGIHFRLGENTDVAGIPGLKIPPEADLRRDLPRIGPLLAAGVITEDDVPKDLRDDPNRDTRAFVGDLRNDENLIVAQLHTVFLRFHNKVVDTIAADPGAFGLRPPRRGRRRVPPCPAAHPVALPVARRQRLPADCHVPGRRRQGPRRPEALPAPQPRALHAAGALGGRLPLRPHHGRGGYDHNRNFGKRTPAQGPGNPVTPFATFNQLFQFTGNGFGLDPTDPTKSIRNPFLGQPTLPFNWIIEFDRFTNKADVDETHFARKIDTRLAPPITQMVNEGTAVAIQDDAGKPIRQLLRHLARRNLLRGYLLSLPTGQSVAAALGVDVMSETELQRDNRPEVNAALALGGFLKHTPLWYYVLKESEVRANGNSLGEVGSHIVCETMIGVLYNDPDSYLYAGGGWNPSKGVKLPNGQAITTIREFLSLTDVPV